MDLVRKRIFFWPMLIGGFFFICLIMVVIKVDLPKALCAKNQNEGQKVFFLNGIF